jgi:tripeptide aminopeptidase
LLFTVSEEIGLVGSKHLGEKVLASPLAVVFDSAGPVGGITVKAPSHDTFKATFRGRAAHAGVEPEKGRSAIQAAAKAIAAMPLGRLDEETSANVGVIHGGVGTNVVPDLCEIEGECRSHDEEKLAQIAAADRRHAGGPPRSAPTSTSPSLTAPGLAHDATVVRPAKRHYDGLSRVCRRAAVDANTPRPAFLP